MNEYRINRLNQAGCAGDDWNAPFWTATEIGKLENYRPEGSDHHPEIEFRAGCDATGLYVRFRVRDRYVRSVQTAFQSSVCTDSCVEFFVQPPGIVGGGYYNFEVNAGGTLLVSHVYRPDGERVFANVLWPVGSAIKTYPTLPRVIDPEITGPVDWQMGLYIPFRVMAVSAPQSGARWTGNFYKCGDKTSHPRWVTWAPVPVLNYHLPEAFGTLTFGS